MTSARPPKRNWWQRLLGPRARPAPQPDPGDMGTAIALDYLLDEPAQSPQGGVGGLFRHLVAPQISSTHQGR